MVASPRPPHGDSTADRSAQQPGSAERGEAAHEGNGQGRDERGAEVGDTELRRADGEAGAECDHAEESEQHAEPRTQNPLLRR